MNLDEGALRTEIDEIITGITFSDDHDELMDALLRIVKRERATGQANAVRNMQGSLLPAMRGFQRDAYLQGYAGAIEAYGTDVPWGGMTPATTPYDEEVMPDADSGEGETG